MRTIVLLLMLTGILCGSTHKPEPVLPEIIPLNEAINYRVKTESWICCEGFVKYPQALKDSLFADAQGRLTRLLYYHKLP
jgi:hypothetical protein